MYNTTIASAARDATLAQQYRLDKAGWATVRTEAEREVDESVSIVHATVSNVLRPHGPLRARGGAVVVRHSMNRRLVDGVAADRGCVELARAYTLEGCERG